MSKENLEQFRELVLSDIDLQNELKKIIDRDEFFEKVRQLGAVSGFEIAREDIERQMNENRKLWHKRWI